MTAINVALTETEVHIFADAAHYDDDLRVVSIASKLFTLPRVNWVVAVCGPSEAGEELQRRLHDSTLVTLRDDFMRAIENMECLKGKSYTAFLMGIVFGRPMVLCVEENGNILTLGPDQTVKTLVSPATFDLQDLIGSALRMAHEQRSIYGAVGGFYEHIVINSLGVSRNIIYDWRTTFNQDYRLSYVG